MTPKQIQVLFPQKLDAPLDYLWSGDGEIAVGQVVLAPLRRKEQVGLVVGTEIKETAFALRDVSQRLDFPGFSQAFVRFLFWVSQYTLTPPGVLLKMVFGGALDVPTISPRTRVQWSPWAKNDGKDEWQIDNNKEQSTAPLLRELLEQHQALGDQQIAHLALSGQLFAGGKKGTSATFSLPPFQSGSQLQLNEAQHYAADALTQAIQQDTYQTFLLDGVTGSGKTEVYFAAFHEVLKQGGQGLTLLPEITLTHQWLTRFKKAFGLDPLVWHSGIPAKQKRLIWHRLVRGEPLMVVGARSALFLPFQNLRLLVVDEEHDQSYKQEEGGSLYHARDMAVVRAAHEKFPVVLASATPSLETLENVTAGKYHLLTLAERAGGAQLPDVTLIDRRKEERTPNQWLSAPLIKALQENKAAGQLSMLFLNRRGYAPLVLCRACGHQFQCPHCSVWLSQHQTKDILMCHHCGHRTTPPESCPSCGSLDDLSPCGPGVERIAEEVAQKLPDLRCKVVTSDHDPDMEEILNAVTQRDVDLLIGTQLLAKGHDFSQLTLVGIVDGDMGLVGGDPRAQEKSFQLLHQVAGRAGRAQQKGHVLIQTYQPESPLMQTLVAHDRKGLMAYEKRAREMVGMPPYGKLATVLVASTQESQAEKAALAMVKHAPQLEGIELLGPMPAPLYKKRSWYRWRFLVKGSQKTALQPFLKEWVGRFKFPATVKVTVDIDPQSFM
ncbi:primosomal protein N' [Alphaproteobacteria bacterium]|nr:primosomal protein N' [Alphaproteobacteria bacterium]